ncbi:MAG: hypothetical protein SangKO_080400 [Sandaracinaceae bacterium]
MIRAWLQAARPFAHANIAPPILVGIALAVASGVAFDPWLAGLAFAFGVLDHLYIVFANDHADRDADALHDAPTPFSGGSRVIPEGRLRPGQLKVAAIGAAGLLLVGSGVVALWAARPWLPALAAAAIALLWAYSYPPLKLSYRGFGEILQGLGVGMVLPLVGYYLQVGSLEATPWEAFAPLVVLGYVSNILTALPDVAADRAAGKRTWPVRRGEARARRDVLVLLGVGLVLVSQVGPPLSREQLAGVLLPPALAALLAMRWLLRADAAHRADLLRFVTFGLGAIFLFQVSWSVALFLR